MVLTDEFRQNISEIDLIVFDIDGVLIDTSDSFPQAIVESVYRYGKLNRITDWIKPTKEQVSAFKRVPGFNNDWDLAEGLLVFQLANVVNSADIDLTEYLGQIGGMGGGITGVRNWVEKYGSTELQELYDLEQIRQLTQEYYAGEKYCEQLYDFEPKYGIGTGTMETETLLVEVEKLHRLAQYYHLGIYTGRDSNETDVALQHIGFDGFAENCIATDDGAMPTKPDPTPINQMLEEFDGSGVLFIGDSRDDYMTIINFREAYPVIAAEFVQISEELKSFEKRTNVVRNVNDLLEQLI